MKRMLLIALVLLLPNLVSAVEIHQIYYDPVNSESGGEAVEFYNPHPFDVDVSGWIIATETSMQDAILPANSTIPAKGYFLLADNMWDERKDDSNWRDADFMTPITLNNANSGVALLNSTRGIMDAVGWGNAAEIDNNLFSGTPANDAPQNKVLLRINNTSDNLNDFIVADPDFFGNNVISVEVNVSDSNPSSAIILEGSSFKPKPGTNTTIHVRSTEALYATLFDITKEMIQIDNTTYEARFTIPFDKPPGNYSIFFSDNTELEFEIQELIAFDVESDKISFTVLPGTSKTSNQKAVIKNTGNTDLMFLLETFGDFIFQYSLDNADFFDFEDTFELSAGESSDLYFKTEIPEETSLGSYKSLITISAE